MIDDIMDQSVLRKGKPCWYKISDAGLGAINDALFLFCGAYKILQKHFAGSKYYLNILHEFHQAILYTVHGQCLDMMFNRKNGKPRFDLFTFKTYETLTEYKLTHLSYILTIRLAMHLAEKYSDKEFENLRKLCLKFGLYLQIKNDTLDFFEKIGNDIAEGRCTWLSVKFLEEATQPMKKKLFENYGVDDKYAIANVLELYKKANLFERFEETEAQLSAEISFLIESKNDIKGALFCDLWADLQKII